MQCPRLSMAMVVGTIVLTGALGLAQPGQNRADSRASLQGVWRIVELTEARPDGSKSTNSNPLPGLYMFTGKHYSWIRDDAQTARPEVPDETKATRELLVAMTLGFIAQSGTYELTGNSSATFRPVVSLRRQHLRPGVSFTLSYSLEGNDTLWMRTQPIQQGGPPRFALKFTRVE